MLVKVEKLQNEKRKRKLSHFKPRKTLFKSGKLTYLDQFRYLNQEILILVQPSIYLANSYMQSQFPIPIQ